MSVKCRRAGAQGNRVNAVPRSKALFFEKKKQKTFDYFGVGLSRENGPQFVKVFWFFFSKKNCFLSSTITLERSGGLG